MEDKKSFSLLVAIVKRGYSESAMSAAREAGARGGTVFNARGTGSLEAQKFLGVPIEPEKEVLLILAEKSVRQDIMRAIYKEAGLETNGNGIVFALPVEDVVGAFTKFNN
ncbi:MAG: P-II family nitrogen regulator [Clostridia bacterium]|nr:P-II family nitrogen regulator [Clostridia bacterium]